MNETSNHKLIADHNGDPVCACGYSATPSESVQTVFDAAAAARAHIRERASFKSESENLNDAPPDSSSMERSGLREQIKDILTRGNVVYEWPDDEAEAYRELRFQEGRDAVIDIRIDKILALATAQPPAPLVVQELTLSEREQPFVRIARSDGTVVAAGWIDSRLAIEQSPTTPSDDELMGPVASCAYCVGSGGYEGFDGEWVECSCQRVVAGHGNALTVDALARVWQEGWNRGFRNLQSAPTIDGYVTVTPDPNPYAVLTTVQPTEGVQS